MSGKDKKSQFYVEYLGWKESRGLRGSENVSPVVVYLLSRYQNARRTITLPKLTIQVSRNKGLKISSQEVVEEKKRKKIKTVKYPTIPANDIAYASQAPQPNQNVVSCIYLGYHPKTEKYAHVHVYSFDRTETAVKFVGLLNQIIEIPNNVKRLASIELDLIAKRQMEPSVSMRHDDAQGNHVGVAYGISERHTTSSGNSIHSDDARFSGGSDDIDPDLKSLADVLPYDSVTAELQQRLANKTEPLLIPPKDYSTILRKHGDTEIEIRKRGGTFNILHFDQEPKMDLNVSNDNEVAPPVDDVDISSPYPSSNNNDSPRSTVSSDKGSFLYKSPQSPDDRPSPEDYKLNSKFGFPEHTKEQPTLIPAHGRQRSQSSQSSNAELRDSSEFVRTYPGIVPEPDYQPDEVIMRNNSVGNWRRKVDLSKSMQETDFRTRAFSEGPPFRDEQRMLHVRNANGVSLSPRPIDLPTSRVRPFFYK